MFKINKRAFTLVEILATIVIIGILITIAVPTFNNIVLNSKEKSLLSEFQLLLNFISTDLTIENFNKTKIDLSNDKKYFDSIKSSSYNYNDGIVYIENNKISSAMVCLSDDENNNYFVKYINDDYSILKSTTDLCKFLRWIKVFNTSNLKFNTEENKGIDEAMYIYSEDNDSFAVYLKISENNNVFFANKNWKIVKLEENKLKIVLDSKECLKNIEQEDIINALSDWYENLSDDYKKYILKSNWNVENIMYSQLNSEYLMQFSVFETIEDYVGTITMQELLKMQSSVYKEKSVESWQANINYGDFSEYINTYLMTKNGNLYYFYHNDGYFKVDSTKKQLCPSIYLDVKNYELNGLGTKENPYTIKGSENL